MARSYTIKIKEADFPLRAQLQTAIKTQGYPLTIEDDYVPFASSGYLPCTLDGEDAGLMIRFVRNVEDKEQAANVSLQWSGDPREKVTVQIISTLLAADFGAIVFDEALNELTAATLSADTQKSLASLEAY
jgi:hypothetical protein